MFQVRTRSPLDGNWERRNQELMERAGFRSDGWGTDKIDVEHVWLVEEFNDALRMKKRLESVPNVKVSIREHTTHCAPNR